MSESLDISSYEFCLIKITKFKYHSFTPSGCKDVGIGKFRVRGKNSFLCIKFIHLAFAKYVGMGRRAGLGVAVR